MAELYLAQSKGISGFEKFVALKMIHSNFSQDQHFVRMLVEEAKITVFLNQVNIAQIFDLGRIDDVYYIAMEYIDGADLYQIMRALTEQGLQMPCDVAAYIMHETCAGLDYAHRCRDQLGNPLHIIHRDISPQNVLVSQAGEVKIIDFGIAKAALRARQTAVGVIKGKYYYMSPEQAWGEPLDHRTDIFSAGVVLYEILAGQMLYLEEDVALLLDKVRRAEIPPLRTKRPDVPPQLEAIVMKAVAKKPHQRWPTAHDFQQALHTFLYRYAPRFTVQKLQRVVHRALTGKKNDVDADGETKNFSREQLMGRRDFSSFAKHSILFSEAESTGSQSHPSFLLASDDGFEDDEKTVVSGPPSFSDTVGGDPALPLVADSVPGSFSDPSFSAEWAQADDETTTDVMAEARHSAAKAGTGANEDEDTETATIPRYRSPAPAPFAEEEETRNLHGKRQSKRAPAGMGGAPALAGPHGGPSPPPPQHPAAAGGQPPPPQPGWPPPPGPAQDGAGGFGDPSTPSWAAEAGYDTSSLTGDTWLEDDEDFVLASRVRTRKVIAFVLVLMVLVAGVVAILVIFWPFGGKQTTGEVQVITDPPGAYVECDGEPQNGLTPDVVITGLEVDENHSLYIKKMGYQPQHKSFTVKSGKRTIVKVKLKRKIGDARSPSAR
jgi:serine/threonine protein kinase